jgi:phosphoglycerate dehydrogenase-like enzyme
MYHLDWIHSITAGIDHLLCPEITQLQGVTITNAKGIYSSSLAEYVMAACSYFNKDIPRLIQNKNDKKWDRFTVGELKGKCLGIIGYGDIGSATARLANAYGMKVLALRKRPELSTDDHWVDRVYGIDGLSTVMAESDFLVVALALTKDTIHFIKEKHLKRYNFIIDNNISLILILISVLKRDKFSLTLQEVL